MIRIAVPVLCGPMNKAHLAYDSTPVSVDEYRPNYIFIQDGQIEAARSDLAHLHRSYVEQWGSNPTTFCVPVWLYVEANLDSSGLAFGAKVLPVHDNVAVTHDQAIILYSIKYASN